MIDLSLFVTGGGDWRKDKIGRPWTRGEYTYATNGHIAVRVPARDDVPDNPDAPDARPIFWRGEAPVMTPLSLRLPDPPDAPEEEECMDCDGTGSLAPCGCDCAECACPYCEGGAFTPEEERQHVRLRGASLDAKYLRMIADLPNLRAAPSFPAAAPCWFSFDGGDIALMPIRPSSALAGAIPDAEASA